MHVDIEKARKDAGISGMKKNYPDNPKQRGCGYWAAFSGSLSSTLARKDEEKLAMIESHAKEMKAAHLRIESLEADLRKAKLASEAKGIEVIRLQEGWPVEKGEEVKSIIAS